MFGFKSLEIPIKEDCLPGRTQAIYNPENHFRDRCAYVRVHVSR